ncbi:uncharacterized protein LOC131684249 [Topomyia yanbarensis]|uniref:uncharacterized protein LOC131684249 n=1 Tax=Topomyia yanbarensis TaxID=2498891 RepID=UPI00273BD3B8|nr:uncharacterized protein LOC131684249 [Topomyia yanbarensis]
MARLLQLILAFGLLHVALARVAARNTLTASTTPTPVGDFIKNLTDFGLTVQKALTETQEVVVKSLGFQSNQDVVETLQNNTHKYVEQLKTLHTTLQKEAEKHSSIFEPVVKDFNAKLAETAKKLSEQKPEIIQKAKEYQETVQANIQLLVTEARKTGDRLKEESRGATDQLQSALKQLFDITVQNLQKTVNDLEAKTKQTA